MKKTLIGLLIILGLGFASIDKGTLSDIRYSSNAAYEWFEVRGETVPSNSAEYFTISSMTAQSICLGGVTISAGTAITTCDILALTLAGETLASDVMTVGTPITAIKSAYYKISIPADPAATRNVTFNFILKK
jgi:hypothetical protein